MPGYKFRPESIVNQIRNNLLDRYESGYPILKELLQNADDAGARRFRLDARAGWPKNAENPLLQGPGLLIVNDGEFRQKDQEGILSFGESVKAADDATIGKFGFGQKAVFHLCDAFAVHAFGQTEPFSDVVNPFEDVEVTQGTSPASGKLSPNPTRVFCVMRQPISAIAVSSCGCRCAGTDCTPPRTRDSPATDPRSMKRSGRWTSPTIFGHS